MPVNCEVGRTDYLVLMEFFRRSDVNYISIINTKHNLPRNINSIGIKLYINALNLYQKCLNKICISIIPVKTLRTACFKIATWLFEILFIFFSKEQG